MQTFGSHVDGYYDVADQLIHDLRRMAEQAFRLRDAEREAIRSVVAFEKYRNRMRANLLRAIGGLPGERVPIEPRITGTIDRGNYVIEKTIYHSLPQFPVTAALYVPKRIEGRAAAVLFVSGHGREAKGFHEFQRVCVDLAENGFVVLAFDPPGQGERMQYVQPETGHEMVGWGVTEHSYVGTQYYVAGMSPARQFIRDAVCGVDYLCSRPEVDPGRIGVTGNSGGGTQTCFLLLCEKRFAAAAPGTFVMDYETYLKAGQSQDAEQNLARCFVDGPDHDDYLTGMAPKPVLILAAAYDFFPIEGALKSLARARRIYGLYGKPGNVDIAIGEHRHEFSAILRQAAVNWFRVHLQGRDASFVTKNPEILPPERLHATETGQVLRSFRDAPTLHSLLVDALSSREAAHPGRAGRKPTGAKGIRKNVVAALAVPGGRGAKIYPRVIADSVVDGYRTEKIFFFSAPDIVVTGVFVHPRDGKADGTELILFPSGTSEVRARRPELEEILAGGRNAFVFDVRGIGAVESRPINPGWYPADGPHSHEWVVGCNAMKLGMTTLGLRVFDVLRGFDYLASRRDAGEIAIRGVGDGAVWACIAAAIEERFHAVTLCEFPPSYRAAVESRFYQPRLLSFRNAAFGILKSFDLPDLAACIAPRPLTVIRPLDPMGRTMSAKEFNAVFVRTAALTGGLPRGWKPALKEVGR